jgi:hypothetical protein
MENNPVFNVESIQDITSENLHAHIKESEMQIAEIRKSENLIKILNTQIKLKSAKSKDINFSKPILLHGENAVIFPSTINVIQGQAGVHKSRLAEILCSAMLRKPDCKNDFLGFQRYSDSDLYTVVYVDTERNLKEQFPIALQRILNNAGFQITDDPESFEFISLLQIDRKQRFEALNDYLTNLREKTSNPLFIILDVSTDCIEDFNKTDKSMELIDSMNIAINDHNVVFLCIIHENPKSDKARGHFGTELMNKSSTVLQVGFEKDAKQNDTDIIRVKYLKCRSTIKHAPFHMKYDDVKKGLVLADESEIVDILDNRKRKAINSEIIQAIQKYLGNGCSIPRIELLQKLCVSLNSGERTIEDRLKEIIENKNIVIDDNGVSCYLNKKTVEKKVLYFLDSFKLHKL